ncbi:serine phosphatase RsbU (regulator of sigma subunit) [Kineococcus radiotolerans]|uniref:Serine phosphatase RsbU (Regulator of sigma subunit) n=1 Tax=Kineococcus radiotolerans TaxID=131568 RepID=A0A7W4TPK6_KINRA|nr:SpoIIE family protein phosphatase [Kineococcus radiotolerans]MBB2902694.1 serine phosphatase RsbU (regulator of sigma subunit) [Kineococcus radiotolerans]
MDERVRGLSSTTLLPAHPDGDFDRFARLGTLVLGVPVALVSMVSRDGQVFPGAVGLPEPWQTLRRTPLTHSLCRYVVTSGEVFTVEDARLDPLTADSLAIPDLGVVAYAGAPLRLPDPLTGVADPDAPVVGVLCAIDGRPRRWSAAQVEVLEDLAAACSAELGLRVLEERNRLLLSLADALVGARTVADVDATVAAVTRSWLGGAWSGLVLADPGHRRLRRAAPSAPPPGTGVEGEFVDLDDEGPVAHVARERRPLLFASAQELREAFPRAATPAEPAFAASAYLPLLVQERLVGVLCLVWDSDRLTLGAEADVWSALARFTAQALDRATLDSERRSRAEVLQRSLLPRLPEATGELQVRGRYVPASREEEVGGDWYDVVVGPGGETTLVLGDVAGHDVVAAATMGQVRGLLRAFTWDRPGSPGELVSRLDSAMAGLGVDGLATLVLARVERRATAAGTRYRLRWTNAGHPPPVLLHPDGRTELLDGASDLLVGLLPRVERHDHVADVPPGATLVLYTDGLIEHRGRSLAGGIARARTTLERHGGSTLDVLLDDLLGELVGTRGEDDCALLAVRFP